MADFAYTQIFDFRQDLSFLRVVDTPSIWPDYDNDDRFEVGDKGLYTGDYLGTVTISGVICPVFQGSTATGSIGYSVIFPGQKLAIDELPVSLPELTVRSLDFGKYALLQPTELDDEIVGRFDNDNTYLRAGNDTFIGRSGNDRAFGGAGNDTLIGGTGDDQLSGNEGNDRLFGGIGSDDLFGHSGRDRIFGGAGSDDLAGYEGADRLDGGAGDDVLSGGVGADLLRGGRGDDNLYGGDGADRIDGGRGNDALYGSAGRDVFVFTRGSGTDVFYTFELKRDRLEIDDSHWRGTLDPGQVVRKFASVEGSDVVFEFGSDHFVLYGIETLQGLAKAIDII